MKKICTLILSFLLSFSLSMAQTQSLTDEQIKDVKFANSNVKNESFKNANVGLAGKQVFIENKGQLADSEGKVLSDVLFNLKLSGMDVYFRKTGLSFVLLQNSELVKNPLKSLDPMMEKVEEIKTSAYRIDLSFEGANKRPDIEPQQETEEYFNYYYGHCPEGINFVKGYEKLIYHNVYEGIDFVFYLKERDGIPHLEYDMLVKPGANPNLIKLKYNTGGIDLAAKKNALEIQSPIGMFKESLGEVYQKNKDNKITKLAASYQFVNGLISFNIPNYDPTKTLVIDPFFTYYGGNAADQGNGIDTDGSNNVVVVGTTSSSGLPVSAGLQSFAGVRDAFVVKMNPAGNRLWSMYYGGSVDDFALGITVDGNSNMFFTGTTRSNNFPVDAAGGTLLGGADAYVVALNGGTGIRRWAKYHGGESGEGAWGICADANNNIVICGSTASYAFPIAGCLPSSYKGGSATAGDAFITRFDNTGLLQWSTYLGGANDEIAYAVTTDNANNVLVTGYTLSGTDYTPALAPARNSNDVFLVKYDANCGFLWGLRYGGMDLVTEYGYGLAVDPINNDLVVVGRTTAADFPVTANVVRNYKDGSTSSIITKFNAAGVMQWSSYFGGEEARGIEIDNNRDIWITGYSNGDINTSSNAVQPAYAGGNDAFVAKVSANGENILCASYYGGSGSDQGNAIALDNIGHVLICGTTTSTNLPGVKPTSLQPTNAGSSDAFIASMCQSCSGNNTLTITDASKNSFTLDTVSICLGDSVQLFSLFNKGTSSEEFNPSFATYSWLPSLGLSDASIANPWAKPTIGTSYTLTGSYGSPGCDDATAKIYVKLKGSLPKPTIEGADNLCVGDKTQLIVHTDVKPPEFKWYSKLPATTVIATSDTLFTGVLDRDTTFYVKVLKNSCSSDLELHPIAVNPLAVINVSGSTSICKGEQTTLNAVAGDITKGDRYVWLSLNRDTLAKTQALSVSPTTTTKYIIYATEKGCANEDTITVTVKDLPLAEAGADKTICAGQSVPLSASGGVSYVWTPTAGLSSTNIANPTASPSTTTKYFVTVLNSLGCSAKDSVTVTVNPMPNPSFTGLGSSYCTSDKAVNLTPTQTGGTFKGAGVTGNTFNPSTAGVGTHSIKYVISANGCADSLTKSVTVNATPNASFTGLNPSYCSSEAKATLTPITSGGTFKGPGISGNSFDPSKLSPGNYTIKYIVTSASGCSDSTALPVEIKTTPNPSFSGLGSSYCTSDNAVSLTPTQTGGTFSGAGVTGNTFNPSTAGVGTHAIKYVISANGCADSLTKSVTVNATPNASFTGLNPSYCSSEGISTLTPITSGGTFKGLGISGNSFDPSKLSPGNYTIKYIVTSASGCSDSTAQPVEIKTTPDAKFTGLGASYCQLDKAVNLVPTQSGGSFSGPGIKGSSFDPKAAGTGTHTVTYEITVKGCTSTSSQSVVVNPSPTAEAGNDGLVCSGAGVTLGAPAVAGFSYVWSPSTYLSSATSAEPVFTKKGSGAARTTEKLFVQVTSDKGCTAIDSIVLTILPSPQANAGRDTFVRCNQKIELLATATGGEGAYSYQWKNGPNTAAYPGVGPGEYIVTVSDQNGCFTRDTVKVGQNSGLLSANPTANPIEICKGESTTLSATVSGNSGAFTVSWSSLDTSFTGSGPHEMYPSKTTEYTLTVKDAGGCEVIKKITVTVNPIPEVQIASSDLSSNGICEGKPLSFKASPAGMSNYRFTLNGADKQTGAGDTYTPSPALAVGSYTLVVEETNQKGCKASKSLVFTVHPSPVADAGVDTTICFGKSVQLKAAGGTAYLWSPATGLDNPGIASPMASPTQTTDYTVQVSNAFGCSSTDVVKVVVNPLPKAIPNYEKKGMTVDFTADNSTNLTRIIWDFGDRTNVEEGQNVSHTFISKGTYTIMLIVENACGRDTVNFEVEVDGGTGVNTQFSTHQLNVYPNPFSNVFTLGYSAEKLEKLKVDLFDVLGREVGFSLSEKDKLMDPKGATIIGDGSCTIELNNKSPQPGIYYLRVQVGEQKYSYKLIHL